VKHSGSFKERRRNENEHVNPKSKTSELGEPCVYVKSPLEKKKKKKKKKKKENHDG
jgi:hypothetical protein